MVLFFLRKSPTLDAVARHASLVREGAGCLRRLVTEWRSMSSCAEDLRYIEEEADRIVHEISNETERTFLLPLDKEDIHEFIHALDDILDNLEEAVHRMSIYDLPEAHPALADVARLIMAATREIADGVALVRDRAFAAERLSACIRTIHELENQGDRLHREFLAKNLGKDTPNRFDDFVVLLKWKEVFQLLEDTLDRCEDIGMIFARIRLKYS